MKYFVTRKITMIDGCYVNAKNKKEAIVKAKNNEFYPEDPDDFELRNQWESGEVVSTSSYDASKEFIN